MLIPRHHSSFDLGTLTLIVAEHLCKSSHVAWENSLKIKFTDCSRFPRKLSLCGNSISETYLLGNSLPWYGVGLCEYVGGVCTHSWVLMCMHAWVLMCMHVKGCARMHGCSCTCIWRPKFDTERLPQQLSTLVFELGSLHWLIELDWLASKPQGSSSVYLPMTKILGMHQAVGVDAGDGNQIFLLCISSLLP